ncbi:hypothetical protein C0J52_21285 [Blattella germanica]|nr:hypothetical protein C0J52_21285 [Blattella germanica]
MVPYQCTPNFIKALLRNNETIRRSRGNQILNNCKLQVDNRPKFINEFMKMKNVESRKPCYDANIYELFICFGMCKVRMLVVLMVLGPHSEQASVALGDGGLTSDRSTLQSPFPRLVVWYSGPASTAGRLVVVLPGSTSHPLVLCTPFCLGLDVLDIPDAHFLWDAYTIVDCGVNFRENVSPQRRQHVDSNKRFVLGAGEL